MLGKLVLPFVAKTIVILTFYIISSVILALAASFLGASGALWIMVFIYAFLSNAFFLVRLFVTHAHFSLFYSVFFKKKLFR